jgi:hypothetical protein
MHFMETEGLLSCSKQLTTSSKTWLKEGNPPAAVCFFKIHLNNNILPTTPHLSNNFLPIRLSDQYFGHNYYFSHARYVLCFAHYFVFISIISYEEKNSRSSRVRSFLQLSGTVSPLGSNILCSHSRPVPLQGRPSFTSIEVATDRQFVHLRTPIAIEGRKFAAPAEWKC